MAFATWLPKLLTRIGAKPLVTKALNVDSEAYRDFAKDYNIAVEASYRNTMAEKGIAVDVPGSMASNVVIEGGKVVLTKVLGTLAIIGVLFLSIYLIIKYKFK